MDRSTKILILALLVALLAPTVLIVVMISSAMDAWDIMIQAILLFTLVPLIALGLYMWATGKGAMLISGYNTSPREVRDLYDSEALARFIGKLLVLSMTTMLAGIEALMLDYSLLLSWSLLIISMATIILGAYYANTGGRFLREGVSPSDVREMAKTSRRTYKALAIVAVIALASIVIVVLLVSGGGSVSASLENDGLRVNAPFVNELIGYENITTVEMRDHFDQGRRVGGFGGTEISSGRYQNDEFGRYTLARFNNISSCIVIHHSGGVLAFNMGTAEGTTQMYDALRARL